MTLTRLWFVQENLKAFRVKLLSFQPATPQRQNDFTLRVQPRVDRRTSPLEAGLKKVPHHAASLPRAVKPGAIAHRLERTVAVPVELLKAQWLVIAGTVADAQQRL